MSADASIDGKIYTGYHSRGDFSWRRSKFVYTITKPDAIDVDLTIWYTTREGPLWVTLAPLQVLPGVLDNALEQLDADLDGPEPCACASSAICRARGADDSGNR